MRCRLSLTCSPIDAELPRRSGAHKATAQPAGSYVPCSALIRPFDEHSYTRDRQLTNTVHFAWVAASNRLIRQTDPNRLKQWRGLATRYEKRALNYRAMVVIASIFIWLDS